MSTSSSSSSSSGSNSSSSSSTSSSLSSPSPTLLSSSSVVALEGTEPTETVALAGIEKVSSNIVDDTSILATTPPGNECLTSESALSGSEIIGEGEVNSTTLIAHSPVQEIINNNNNNNISIIGPLTPLSSTTANCDSGGNTTPLLQQQPITPPSILNVATPTSTIETIQDCIENNNNNILLENINQESLFPSAQTSSTNINNETSVSCDIVGSLTNANLNNINIIKSNYSEKNTSNCDIIDNNNIVGKTTPIPSPLSLVTSSSSRTVSPFVGLESTTLASPLSLATAGLMNNIKEEPHTTPTSISSASGLNLIGESSGSKQIKLEDDVISSVNTPPSVGIKKEPIQQQQLIANGSNNVSALMSINSGINSGNGNNNSTTNNSNNVNNNNIGSTNTGSIPLNSSNGAGNSGEKTSNENSIAEDLLSTKDDILTDPLVGLVSLTTIKKEEPGPTMSPDNFGQLGIHSGVSITGVGNSHLLNTGRGSVSNGAGNGGSSSNIITGMNSVGSGGGGNGIGVNQNIPPTHIGKQTTGGNNGGGGMTSMDYSMQQQNHIFVFSTQLANRGAESVLSGQFPTIIAYHCAQPNTKKFLDDFFQKNPMKLSKINRQNLVTGQWMNNTNHSNVLAKMASQQHNKSIGGTVNNNSSSSTISQNNNNNSNNNNNQSSSATAGGAVPSSGPNTTTVRIGPKSSNSNSTQGFGGPEDISVGPDAADLLSWDASGNHLGLDSLANGGTDNNSNCGPQPGNSGSVGPDVMDDSLVPDSPSVVGSGPQRSCNNMTPISSATTVSASSANIQQSPNITVGPGSPSEGLQPSLQGVKVPDENLTPQQRQHREEQLAKLKKMNQFLFPEHGGMGEFAQPHLGGDQVPPTGGKLLPGVGSQAVGPVNMMSGNPNCGPPGNLPVMPSNMLRGSNMMGGISPRNAICRPSGMGVGSIAMSPDMSMMSGGGPHNNGPQGINDLSGMQCGGMVMGHNQAVGGSSGGNSQSSMMGGVGPGSMGVMIGGSGSTMGHQSGGPGVGMSMGQKAHMNIGGGPGMAQMEWSKLQHQFYEERKGKGLDGINNLVGMCSNNMPSGRQMQPGNMRSNIHPAGSGSRSQGPPPPYHQTTRSASVPIATQSPNPGSPNNPTSNLSLPSPRTGSTLNSPAGDLPPQANCNSGNNKSFKQDSPITAGGGGGNNNSARQSLSHSSNPSTPISHMSPNASLKDLELGGSSVLNNSSTNSSQGKDASLMPVPSPQQIQYLNAFEGQELTIQKQPNTLLKDNVSCISMSPPSNQRKKHNFGAMTQFSQSTGMDSLYQATQGCGGIFPMVPISSICSSHIPNSKDNSNNCDKNQRINSSSGPSPQGSRTPQIGDLNNTSNIDTRFPPASPGMNFSPITGGPTTQQPPGNGVGNNGGISISGNNVNAQQQSNVMKIGFMDVSPNGKCSTSTNDTPTSGANFCVRSDNLPLNPNSNCPPPTKSMEFDPISSLAQMSQQLTSSVSNALNGQPGGPGNGVPGGGVMGGGFPNHPGGGGMGDMQMGGGMAGVDSMMGPGGLDSCGMGGMPHNMGIQGQYGMHGPNSGGMGSMGMMGGPPGGPQSLSPKAGGGLVGFPGGPGGVGMPQHRMIGRPGMGGSPYNGANIQVKASTPNTIQYLPARPQVSNTNPRVPSLEFLQRYTNPQMSGMDGGGGSNVPNKMQNQSVVQGMNFYPNCNQMQGPMGGMGSHMDSGMGGPDGMIGMGPGGGVSQMGGINQQNIMMRGLRPPGQGGGILRMQVPMGGGPGPHHHPYSNGPGGPNGPTGDASSMFPVSQIFGQGAKGNLLTNSGGLNGPQQMSSGGPPDASQPLPPSMVGPGGPGNPGGPGGPVGNFKSSQFVGPSTADPNYAQQFHNFQQQLYATSTRSHINNQPGNNGTPGGMPGNGGSVGLTGPIGPSNPNQTYFVPK